MSGYRQAFELNDPRASLNPVNYSHLLLTVAGRRYSVLSRVCDAGMDYTQRTNKLAHHVALTDIERTAGGPAWALAQPGFCITQWDGPPRHFPTGRLPASQDSRFSECRDWKALTGDAGWAGILAESVMAKPSRTASVIFSPGQDMLPLLVEALSLVPPHKRWDVTFSTYFTRLPAGLECHWRFLLEGSPESNAVRNNPHALVIDLSGRLGRATGGNLVEAARSGVRPPEHETPRATAAAPATENRSVASPAGASRDKSVRGTWDASEGRTYALRDNGGRDAIAHGTRGGASYVATPKQSSSLKWTLVGLAALLAIGLFAGGIAVVIHSFAENAPVAIADNTTMIPAGHELKKPSDPAPPRGAQVKSASAPPKVTPPTERSVAAPPKRPAPTISAVPQTTKQPVPAPPKDPDADVFQAIEKRNRVLRLPSFPDFDSPPTPPPLAELKASDPSQLKWHLLGADIVFGPHTSFEFTPDGTASSKDTAHWTVSRSTGTGSLADQVRIGTFSAGSGSIQFAWVPNVRCAANDIDKLKYCPLEIEYHAKRVVVQFENRDATVERIPFAPAFGHAKKIGVLKSLQLDKKRLPLLDHMNLTLCNLTAHGWPKNVTLDKPKRERLSAHGKRLTILKLLRSDADFGIALQPFVDLEIRLSDGSESDFDLDVNVIMYSPPYEQRSKEIHVSLSKPTPRTFTDKELDRQTTQNKKIINEYKRELEQLKKENKAKEKYALPIHEERGTLNENDRAIRGIEGDLNKLAANQEWFNDLRILIKQMKDLSTLSFELSLPVEASPADVVVLRSSDLSDAQASSRASNN